MVVQGRFIICTPQPCAVKTHYKHGYYGEEILTMWIFTDSHQTTMIKTRQPLIKALQWCRKPTFLSHRYTWLQSGAAPPLTTHYSLYSIFRAALCIHHRSCDQDHNWDCRYPWYIADHAWHCRWYAWGPDWHSRWRLIKALQIIWSRFWSLTFSR